VLAASKERNGRLRRVLSVAVGADGVEKLAAPADAEPTAAGRFADAVRRLALTERIVDGVELDWTGAGPVSKKDKSLLVRFVKVSLVPN